MMHEHLIAERAGIPCLNVRRTNHPTQFSCLTRGRVFFASEAQRCAHAPARMQARGVRR